MVKNLLANAGDATDSGSVPRLGRSPGEGNGNPLQYSCLENSMDRGAYSSWDCKESDMTEHTHTQSSLGCAVRFRVYEPIYLFLFSPSGLR